MKTGKNRSARGRIFGQAGNRSAQALVDLAGRMPPRGDLRGRARSAWREMETLENRVLLYGDHPGLFTPIPSGPASTVVVLDVSGNGSVNGIIQPVGTGGPGGTVPAGGDNDLFSFVAPANDFVRILAATVSNAGVPSGLNSRIRVFDSAGNILTTTAQFQPPATPGIQLQGDNNGILSTTRPNPAPDGWAGFVASLGQTYYVQVLGEFGTTGSYTFRVGAKTTAIVPDAMSGEVAVPPEIAPIGPYTPPIPILNFPEDEMVWKISTLGTTIFDSVATVTAAAFRAPHAGLPPIPASGPVDTHLEVYDSTGRQIVSDIEAGFLNDAFAAWKAAPNATYFIRVRGDDLRNPATFNSTGPFQVRVDMVAQELDNPVSPITRRGDAASGLADAASSVSFRFQAQGTGLTFITARQQPPPPHDVSARVYDNFGNFIGFNDDFTPIGGTDAEIQIQLVGGQEYFVIVDGFDDAASGAFGLWIEAHHTFVANEPIDDHVPFTPSRRAAEFATPIQFGDPFLLTDSDANPVRDRSYMANGFADGRIFGAADSDFFMFHPQVDMLGDYAGNNDDAGISMFLGGAFTIADPNAANFVPVGSRGVTPWDAGDFWFTGPQGLTGLPPAAAPLDRFGFADGDPATDNPDVPNLPGTTTDAGGVVYTMQAWQPGGYPRPLLFVGGDFNLVVPGAFGPVALHNMAAWAYNPNAGKYVWFGLGNGNANQPIRALAVYDPVTFDPDAGDTGPGTGGGQSLDPIPDTRIESIYFGGDFTTIGGTPANRIAGFNLVDGFFGLGAGIPNGSVRALAVFDPPDPGDDRAYSAGPPVVGRVRDIPDPPISLFVGGTFTNVAGLGQGQLARWDGNTFHRPSFAPVRGTQPGIVANPEPVVTFTVPAGQTAAVNALHVYTQPTVTGGPTQEPKLIIGGRFDSVTIALLDYAPPAEQPPQMPPNPPPPNVRAAETIVANNIIQFGRKASNTYIPPDGQTNNAVNLYQPRLLYEAMFDPVALPATPIPGVGGVVRALTVWDPPDVAGAAALIPPLLIIGGDFLTAGGLDPDGPNPPPPQPPNAPPIPTPAGHLAAWDGGWGAFGFGSGANGPVYALSNQVGDVQEPSIPRIDSLFPPATDPQEVLYVGGNFTSLAGTPVANVAQIDFNPNIPGFEVTRLNSGVNAAVFSLAPFDDQNPAFDNSAGFWDRNDRSASRLQIIVQPTADSFLNTFIRIYDSNLNLIYTNDTIAPPFPDPSGMIDPSTALGTAFPGIQLWGGETYYIEVVGVSGTGRYNIQMRIDAVPPDLGGPGGAGVPDGAPDDVISTFDEVPNEGQFPQAPAIDRDLTNGDGRNYLPNNLAAYGDRVYRTTPSGHRIIQLNELAGIETIADTDLYSFIAEESGTVQVRIVTTDLGNNPANATPPDEGDEFFEREIDFSNTPPQNPTITDRGPKIKAYNSFLNAALRIFNNDFQQIGLDDDNPAVTGESQFQRVGTFQRRFYHRDPMITFNVRQGEKYYIQVESAQRALLGTPNADKIDWRYATGSYELLVDSMPQLSHDDDHLFVFPTPVPIGVHDPVLLIDPPNGGGTVSGVIDNTLANPDDVDSFFMNTVAKGPVTLTFAASGTSTLRAGVTVTDAVTLLPVATGANGVGTPAVLTWIAQQGDTFYIDVDGVGASEGAYTITIQGLPFVDDQPRTHFEHPQDPIYLPNDPVTPGAPTSGNFFGSQWDNATPLIVNRFFGTAVLNRRLEDAADTDVYSYTSETFEVATITIHSTSASLDPVVRIFEVGADPAGNPVYLQIGFNDDGPGIGLDSRVQFSMTPGRPYYVLVSGFNPDSSFGNYTVTFQVAPTDDHPNLSDRPVATQIPIVYDALSGVGTGGRTGIIERSTDDDLFVFTAPATGGYFINIQTPGSLLAPKVELRNSAGVLITSADGTLGAANVGATSGLVAGAVYYIVVKPGTVGAQQTDLFGSYTVDVTTLPTDDHPDAGQFALIGAGDTITLNPGTGVGAATGIIVPFSDTDLFKVTTLAPGQLVVQLTTATNSAFNGRLQLFDAGFNLIASNSGDATTALVSTTALAAGQVYYILVLPDTTAAGPNLTGAYSLRATGAIGGGGGGGGGGGPDDHPNAGDFTHADGIILDARTGAGSGVGVINFLGDTDLFTFTTAVFAGGRSGSVYIQVVTPAGGALDASIRIFDVNLNEIRFNALGIPGATAATSFTTTGGKFYALVEQVGSNVGAYTLRIASDPGTSFLYYPEGFSGSTINEYVPLVNANAFTVHIIAAIAHYEFDPSDPGAARDQVLALSPGETTLLPNSRGGFTVSTKDDQAHALVRIGHPYSLEIQSDGPLGGTFSHYDFGVTVGESFTNRVSTIWTFAEAQRDPANYRDFLVFFNPNNATATVTITLTYTDGTVTTLIETPGAMRRGGINFTDDTRVTHNGVFSIKVQSDLGIVAALSSYDYVNGRGDGWLGDPDGGSVQGVIPAVSSGSGVDSRLSIYNANPASATVTIRVTYNRVDLPDLVKVLIIGPNSRLSTTLADQGMVAGQVAGLKYTSNVPVTLNVLEYRNGDGDSAVTATEAATTAVVGDAFVNPAFAGILYIEELGLYNPAAVDVNVTITYLFTDGTIAAQAVNVAAGKFAFLRIDQQPAILNRVTPTAFSIRLDATTPFISSFTHYDLFLNGGWRAVPAPVGLTGPLSLI